jgi:hypothetical protein
MNLKKTVLPALVAGSMLISAGCAAVPSGARVPHASIEHTGSTANAEDQGQACLVLSRRYWDRDVLESLRYLRRGTELRDAECAREYIACAESAPVNHSQRVYARLFLEGVLRQGPLLTRSGEDIRGELYYQLCWAWSHTEPRSPSKAKQVLGELLEVGAASEYAGSAFIVQKVRETGFDPREIPAGALSRQEIGLDGGGSGAEVKDWLQVPLAGKVRVMPDWAVFEANAWGGGNDRLFFNTHVLAFLVNAKGEPSFRGTHLWICNLGTSPVYLTSLATRQNNRELRPGQMELLAVNAHAFERSNVTTEIPLSIRHHRIIR